jgi:uncharacterized protein
MHRDLTLLVKPAGPDCPLACDYCFYRDRDPEQTGIHRMSTELRDLMIREAMDSDASMVRFVWQGGEPTLMGRPFFEEAVTLQKRLRKKGQRIENALQTGGPARPRSTTNTGGIAAVEPLMRWLSQPMSC